MYSNSNNGNGAAWARGFAALSAIMLAMGLGLMASPAAAQPFAYVANANDSTVSVIDTATNTVVRGPGFPLAVGNFPAGIAVTPDGKHAYVTNLLDNTVSVIDTATNTVEAATLAVGIRPFGVGIVPPPQGIPFLAFSAKLQIALDRKATHDSFALESSFTLSSAASNGINPVAEPVTLQIGPFFTTTIPPGSFKKNGGLFTFAGVIASVRLQALIALVPTGTPRYAFVAAAEGASLTGSTNPVPVTLKIGDDTGVTSVKALIFH